MDINTYYFLNHLSQWIQALGWLFAIVGSVLCYCRKWIPKLLLKYLTEPLMESIDRQSEMLKITQADVERLEQQNGIQKEENKVLEQAIGMHSKRLDGDERELAHDAEILDDHEGRISQLEKGA